MLKTQLKRRWKLNSQSPEVANKLAGLLQLPQALAQVLLNRGITSIQEAARFLNPLQCANLKPKVQLEAFEVASKLILAACKHQERVILVGDYDVDGVSSTAMLKHSLDILGAKTRAILPHRIKDGYGLSQAIVNEVLASKPDLVISLDCGISNVNEIAQLATQSKTLIVDHHQLPDPLPQATCILNPKFEAPEHPYFDLCTAGLVYVFLSYFQQHHCPNLNLDFALHLACLGTVADVVPLKAENRRLVCQGLQDLHKSKIPGLQALLHVCNISESVDTQSIGYNLAPRLNAAGRLYDAKLALDLLLETDLTSAKQKAYQLDKINYDRRLLGQEMLSEALDGLSPESLIEPVIIISKDAWHPGLIGIIASHLVKRFHKPAIVIANQGNIAKASARSIPNVDLYSLLKHCCNFFETFGGHHQAAGFSIKPENITDFMQHLTKHARVSIPEAALTECIAVDSCLEAKDITLDFYQSLQRLAPFGQGNPAPIFYCKQLRIIDFKWVGKQQQHLKLSLGDAEMKQCIDAIGFNLAHLNISCSLRPVELLFKLSLNTFRGLESLQLDIIDLR